MFDTVPPLTLYLIGIISIAILVFLLHWFCRRRSSKSPANLIYSPIAVSNVKSKELKEKVDSFLVNSTLDNCDQSTSSATASTNIPEVNFKLIEEFAKWGKLIARDYLQDGTLLGKGTFGFVFKGILNLPGKETITVVTKVTSLNQSVYTQEFISDALVLVTIDHKNILPLIGMIFNEDRLPYLVYPFVPNGDLLTYLCSENNKLTLQQMAKFALDIASGMEFLIDNAILHRNLAARNCFLDDCLNVLVGDIGFTTVKYSKVNGKKSKKIIPGKRWRWQAYEVLVGPTFTEKSDVYSFGVTVWEILTHGQMPFAALRDDELKKHLKMMKSGKKLYQPQICPRELYYLLTQCWSFDPSMRPTFSYVIIHLSQLCASLNKSFDLIHHRDVKLAPVPEEDDAFDDDSQSSVH